jgi:hypothetical protein
MTTRLRVRRRKRAVHWGEAASVGKNKGEPVESFFPLENVCVLFQVSVTCSPRNLLAKAKSNWKTGQNSTCTRICTYCTVVYFAIRSNALYCTQCMYDHGRVQLYTNYTYRKCYESTFVRKYESTFEGTSRTPAGTQINMQINRATSFRTAGNR